MVPMNNGICFTLCYTPYLDNRVMMTILRRGGIIVRDLTQNDAVILRTLSLYTSPGPRD